MNEAIARQILANALEVMADEGVTDETATRETMGMAITLAIAHPQAVDAEDVTRLALGLIGARRGGPEGIADWAEELARSIRLSSTAPPTLN